LFNLAASPRKEGIIVRSKREVRYVVSRLKNLEDLEGERVAIGWYPFLDLAKNHADRMGPGTFVDAEGGTYYFDGPYGRRTLWQVEWTNPNLYQGRTKRSALPGGALPGSAVPESLLPEV
jgi:hypothetical protein